MPLLAINAMNARKTIRVMLPHSINGFDWGDGESPDAARLTEVVYYAIYARALHK